MSNKLVEIARFFDAIDAHILRALLEENNIHVEIFDEQFSSLTPVNSVISGGVKLYIFSSDLAKAEPIIKQYYDNLNIETGNVCPECGSLNINRDYMEQVKMFFYAILGAVFGTGFNRRTPQYKKCLSCGNKW